MLQVVAAIIRDEQNRLLICQRKAGGSCAFLWEFPGGKLEEGETLEECAVRECREELSVDIRVGPLFGKAVYTYPEQEIAFAFFEAQICGGELKMNVHKDVRWVAPDALKDFTFCPADVDIVSRLAKEKA